jgi:hypothetical protein
LLELVDDGGASVAFSSAEIEADFLASCFSDAGYDCTSVPGLECARTECGLCHCTLPARESGGEGLDWSVDEGHLILEDEQSVTDFVAFCQQGDTLKYQLRSGTTLTFQRRHRTGRPLSCAERADAECTGQCFQGQCMGSSYCGEEREPAKCAKLQGCTWDPEQCAGDAGVTCTLYDYFDHTPGCELSRVPAVCSGKPLP